MHYKQFTTILRDITENMQTSYMLGCFGQPATTTNISRAVARTDVNNRKYEQGALSIKGKGFMFDCVCLIKAILWGWCADLSKTYGGAVYASNGVPDIGADTIITKCKNVSTNFAGIKEGELVWMKGHVGIYVGGGKVVECTPKWSVAPGVKYSYLGNLGFGEGKSRIWTKHGMLPWIDYTEKVQDEKVDNRYHKIDDIPSYAKEAIKYFIDNQYLQGEGSQDLNLSEDMVRLLTILYRMCKE